MPTEPGESRYQVRALERALDILDAFSLAESQLSLTAIAARVGLAKSTTTRLLSVLEERGYLERSPETERYGIGVRAFEVGSVYIQTTTIEAEAEPALRRLARECQQTANLGILSRGEVVHLAVVAPDRPIRYYATVGQRESAHCTGLGKVLLATLDDGQLDEIIAARGLPRRTEYTITAPAQLRAQLARVRAAGFALDEEEAFPGLKCVAAPIRDHKGRTVAALSVSGPAPEFAPDALGRYTAAVLRAAGEVSARLGRRPVTSDE
jgi:DNA-binding IclR family transcriptional regulator